MPSSSQYPFALDTETSINKQDQFSSPIHHHFDSRFSNDYSFRTEVTKIRDKHAGYWQQKGPVVESKESQKVHSLNKEYGIEAGHIFPQAGHQLMLEPDEDTSHRKLLGISQVQPVDILASSISPPIIVPEIVKIARSKSFPVGINGLQQYIVPSYRRQGGHLDKSGFYAFSVAKQEPTSRYLLEMINSAFFGGKLLVTPFNYERNADLVHFHDSMKRRRNWILPQMIYNGLLLPPIRLADMNRITVGRTLHIKYAQKDSAGLFAIYTVPVPSHLQHHFHPSPLLSTLLGIGRIKADDAYEVTEKISLIVKNNPVYATFLDAHAK